MFFELLNSLAIVQDYINKILAKKFVIFVIVYQNNIPIYTENTGQKHTNIVKKILQRLN